MKRRNDWIVLASSLLVMAALALLAAYRVHRSRSEAMERSAEDFASLSRLAASSLGMGGGPASKVFREQMRQRIERSPSLLGVILRNKDGGSEWVLPTDSPYLMTRIGPTGIRADSFDASNRLSILVKRASLSLADGSQRNLEAAYVILRNSDISLPLRDSLIGLLVLLAVLIASLISLYVRSEDEADDAPGYAPPAFAAAAASPSPADIPYAPPSMRAAFKDDEFTIPDIVIDDEPSDGIPGGLTLGQLDPLPPEADETPSAAERPLLDAQDDVRQAEALGSGDLDNAASPEDVSPSGGSSPADAPAADAPRGLYTERSGLGWEAYLPDRLEAELSRSASLEQDCSLILFHLDGADQASDAYAALARAIPSFFTFRDLAFERGQDGFAMILPGIDLNRALRMAEDFLKKLTLDLTGAIPKPGPELLPLYMGVSSRSGRLVKAERLLDESARALDKARTEGDSRIVGFRANPDRYRDFIAGKF